MAAYAVEITRSAAKQLRRLERGDQLRIATAIDALAEEPRPMGCRSLKGVPGAWRVRVGAFRIIYEVFGRQVRVVVLKIDDGRDVYR